MRELRSKLSNHRNEKFPSNTITQIIIFHQPSQK